MPFSFSRIRSAGPAIDRLAVALPILEKMDTEYARIPGLTSASEQAQSSSRILFSFSSSAFLEVMLFGPMASFEEWPLLVLQGKDTQASFGR